MEEEGGIQEPPWYARIPRAQAVLQTAMYEGTEPQKANKEKMEFLLSQLFCSSHLKLKTEKDKLGVVLHGTYGKWRPADLEFKVILG